MDSKIGAVFIDTCIFYDLGFDFMDVSGNNPIIEFLDFLESKGIPLLSHPILEGEVIKHIKESGIVKSFEDFKNKLVENSSILSRAKINVGVLKQKVEDFNIVEKTIEAYKNRYKNAIVLEYPNPERVFEQYFAGDHPFKGKDKKHEFPDAFVIEAIKKDSLDLIDAPSLLVVSSDGGWRDALFQEKGVFFANSLEDAKNILNALEKLSTTELEIGTLLKSLMGEMKALKDIKPATDTNLEPFNLIEQIKSKVKEKLSNISGGFFVIHEMGYGTMEYYLDESRFTEVEVEKIDAKVVPLEINKESITFRLYMDLLFTGEGEYLDLERSYYDKETNRYLVEGYTKVAFEKATSLVECVVKLELDEIEEEKPYKIIDLEINKNKPIEIVAENLELDSVDPEDIYYDGHGW